MAVEINSLDMESLRKIKAMLLSQQNALRNIQEWRARMNREAAPAQAYVCKTTSGITAMSGDTPGVGTAEVHVRRGADTTPTSGGTLTNTNQSIHVFNLTPNAVDNETWIMVKRDAFGDYWVDLEACDP